MSIDRVWNDQSREELRERLRQLILGEIRLSRRGRQELLDLCSEGYIQEDAPEEEWETFIQFSTDELDRVISQLYSEKSAWPHETDCDRLDRVENTLRERGILLWQASPCCDTCTGAELPDRIEEIDQRFPGFRDDVRGYAFFIDQNMPENLAESTDVSVFLAYGWFSPDESEIGPEEYVKNALGIAREVCACLHEEGLEPNWHGDFDRKIGVSLKWQRRTMLE